MSIQKKIELLSPAKNFEFGKKAINFGADAVYIGAPKFGARASAGNSISEIEQLCNYAHKFHSKVYVALNTILYENELIEAEKIISEIYNAGADALIIQDMGILEMSLPPIHIHASTQTHNIDSKKISFFQKIGISRVILARELSIKEISEINQNTNIELEAFIHGALCVSYSGQCYMSAYIGSRSGNRGECAQTCRMKFDLLDSNKQEIVKDKHIMSIKDMNRSASISEMIDAGISSLKIEGRMKDENYLKNVTSFYRKKMDSVLEQKKEFKKASIGKYYFDFEPDAEITFNRRYSEYFLKGRKPGLNSESPKSVGKELGKIKYLGENYFILDSITKISNGDGLCFFDKHNELVGFSVNKIEGEKIFFDNILKLTKETVIFRNNDHDFIKKLSNSENARFIEINIKFSEKETGFELEAQTIDKIYLVKKELVGNKETAKNIEKSQENLISQLKKTGGTIFKIKDLEINLSQAYFIPISEINRIRREVLEELYILLGSKYIKEEKLFEKSNFPYFEEILDYKANVSNSLAEKFYINHGVKKIEAAFELQKNKSGKTLMTTKMCIKFNMGMCTKYQKPENIVEPKFLKLNNEIFNLDFDCDNCVMKIGS